MAKTKAAGSTRLGRDSQPKYLGVKLFEGEKANAGSIIIRQRGSKVNAGKGTMLSKDFTIMATCKGRVKFLIKQGKKFVSVV